MQFGVTTLSVVPVRSKPAHEAEQVTQLLFGDIYTIEETHGNWLRIHIAFDGYTGWIHTLQGTIITEQQYKTLSKASYAVAAELVQTISSNGKSFPVMMGSILYDFDGMNCKLLKENYVYSGQAVKQNGENRKSDLIKKLAVKFLNAPYLWGGKTAFGVDCSGFTQTVYKTAGIHLPRDAYQQAEKGKTVNFIFEAKVGDLLFFDNEEGRITHTGIYLHENTLIHASGMVRIDAVDHHGIFNRDLKKYTHKLRIIKRLL
jgi:cell wall-associated NlpC family hydrolase